MLPIRALTVGDVLDGGFRLLRDRFGRLALLVLVVLGPFELLTSLATYRLLPRMNDPTSPLEPSELLELDWGLIGGFALVTTAASVLIHALVAGGIVWMLDREDRGERPSVGDALRGALGRAGAMVGGGVLILLGGLAVLAVLGALGAALGTVALPVALLLGIPAGLLLLAALTAASWLVPPVAIMEEVGPVGLVGRVLRLLRGRFWPIVGVLVLLVLILGIVGGVVGAVLGILALIAGEASWVLEAVSSTLVSVVMTPVTVIAGLLLYLDARVRLEGWDLQLRARESGSG